MLTRRLRPLISGRIPRIPGTGRWMRGMANLPESTNGEQVSKVPPPQAPAPQRVTYEYPPPPKSEPPIPKESSAWRRHIPLLVGIGGAVWAFYAYNYIFNSKEGEQTVLAPTKFTSYKITYREDISPTQALIELSPKFAAHLDLLKSGGSIWNGKKLWSVEVKHPEIQITRKYTPLPLYYMQSKENGENQALLRMLGTAPDEGRMVLLVKRYDDGEMSRYLHSLPVGADVELRGPHIEHKFPYTHADMQPLRSPMLDVPTRVLPEPEKMTAIPDNISFFTAGTGIAPALQCLLSTNPPRGFTNVYHSVRSEDDLILDRFRLFLERTGRAKFHLYIDDKNKFLTNKDVPSPTPRQARALDPVDPKQQEEEPTPSVKYQNAVQQFADKSRKLPYAPGPALAVVCGPPGYIAYVAGDPGRDNKTPVGGLLGQKGWDLNNTTRMMEW